jgi:hypothetical protein
VFGVAAAWLALTPLAARRRWLPIACLVAAVLFGAHDLGAPIVAALLLLVTHRVARRFLDTEAGIRAAGLWLGFLLLLVLHLPLRWYPRDYYFVGGALCGVLTLAPLATFWLGDGPIVAFVPLGKRLSVFWLAVAVSVLADRPLVERYPWQEEMGLAARHVHHFVGADAGIAAFNSGLLGFYYQGPVLNLDGVVDGASLQALRAKRLAAWLAEQEFHFVLDSPRQMARTDPDRFAPHACGRYFGDELELTPLVAFDLPGVGGRHPGTDCQMLYGAGTRLAWRPPAATVLGRDGAGVVLALTLPESGADRAGLVVEQDGRQWPLPIDRSALAAEVLVTRIAGEHGRLQQAGSTILQW